MHSQQGSSEDSGLIDERPHRPPPPISDFERYQQDVADLTNEEYQVMFHDGLRAGLNQLYESPRDSASENERYLDIFIGPDGLGREGSEREEESGESADSREYTIRDGSSASGGSYEGFGRDGVDNVGASSSARRRGRGGGLSTAVAMLATLPREAESIEVAVVGESFGGSSCQLQTLGVGALWIAAVLGFVVGMTAAWCCMSCKVRVTVETASSFRQSNQCRSGRHT